MTFDYPDEDNKKNAQVTGTTPGLRLNGTETNGSDLTIRENAGTIELYDEATDTVAAAWNFNPLVDITGDTDHAAADHESGGALEIDVTGLTGNLSDPQDPKTHATTHEAGGGDPITLGNIASMDAVAVLIGTASNRPAAGTRDQLFVEADTGTIYRDNGSTWSVMGTTNMADTDHAATNHTGFRTSDVLRDVSGNVQFKSAGTASSTLTTTGSTATTTNTTEHGNYTKAQLTLTGTFTTATATANRNGSQIAQLTTAGTTTVTATTATASPTWTLSANLAAGSNATANLSPSINQTTVIY